MTNMDAYWNASLCDAISAWQSFRNNILLGHKPTWDEWLNDYECNKPPQIRNCDRFKTVGAAHKAWRQTSQDVEFADWLFATEEGGAE